MSSLQLQLHGHPNQEASCILPTEHSLKAWRLLPRHIREQTPLYQKWLQKHNKADYPTIDHIDSRDGSIYPSMVIRPRLVRLSGRL